MNEPIRLRWEPMYIKYFLSAQFFFIIVFPDINIKCDI